jgi:hypothetical protein
MDSRPRCSTSVPSISIAFNLRLSDVAEVRRGYEDPPTLLIRHHGEPALALGVVRRQAAREFASPKVRFAMDSKLEGRGFEKVVREHGTFGYIDTSLATPDMNAFLRG